MRARGDSSGRDGQNKGIKRGKLTIIKYISHRDVMYSTENIVNNIIKLWCDIKTSNHYVVYLKLI